MRSLLLLATIGLAACSCKPSRPQPALLVAARQQSKEEPTPAVKLLDVVGSTGVEVGIILGLLKVAQQAVRRAPSEGKAFWIGQLAWFFIVQGSSRLQGVVQKSVTTLNEDWYSSLTKPKWNPPNWAFPVAWIPLKLAQTYAAGTLWHRCGNSVFNPAVVSYVVHIALGDTWNSQFFLKQRPLTGLLTIGAFWATSVGSTALFAMTSPLAGALLAPTVAWVAVASSLNLDIWYLNRNKNK